MLCQLRKVENIIDGQNYEYVKEDGSELVVKAGEETIDVRNHFWKAIAQSSKVSAVLTRDEHCYHRLLVDNTTPAGVLTGDDGNGDGILNKFAPNPEFIHPTVGAW